MRNFAGMLGLVGLFVAIVVGMLATFGAFGQKASEGSIRPGLEAATTETTNQRAEQAASIGETVKAGNVSWIITDAYRKGEVSTYNFPPGTEPGSFVRLNFTVKNVSDQPVTLTDSMIVLYDASGTEYLPPSDRNTSYIVPKYAILFNDLGLLEPGESREGKVNFEVLSNAEGFVALLKDTNPNVDKGKYVDLGF